MTQLPILVAAKNLTKSPSNVRTVHDAVADAQLEANIAVKGVRQNLIGVPVSRKKGHYRIIAGGRRLDAVHRLIQSGHFNPDYQIAVLVLGNAKDAIETSLEENFFNLAMNPADTCRAFQDIIGSEGKTPEEVAKRFGLTERFVRSRLRLADLAEPVFEALRRSEISLSVAVAYASNSDQVRQAEVFELLKDGYYHANVNEIRRQLTANTYCGSDPKAVLVGRDAYIGAGGKVDIDLFTDSSTERWVDGDVLDRLAAEKLAAAAEAIREREGFADVRVVPSTHLSYSETWDMTPLKGDLPPLSAEMQTRLSEIEAALQDVSDAYEDADEDAALELTSRAEQLEAEYHAIENPLPIFTDEQRASALAYVVIGHDGHPRLHEQLYIAATTPATADAQAGGSSIDEEQEECAKDTSTAATWHYSQRHAQELAEMKSELVRVHIARDPRFAIELGTFWMVDRALRQFAGDDLITDIRATSPCSPINGFVSETLAAEGWAANEADLDRCWADEGDAIQRYEAFCELGEPKKAAWLAWAVARTLHAVVAGGKGAAFIDHLGVKLEIDVAQWWRPTAKNFFDRLTSKSAILGCLEEVGGKELSSRYSAAKKHDLATSAEMIFAGSVPIEAEARDAAMAWVPGVMTFSRAEENCPVETHEAPPETSPETEEGRTIPQAA